MRVAAILLLLSSAAGAQLHNPDTDAKNEPVQETRFGISIDDPYRWMEDPARRADLEAFVKSASSQTIEQLRRLPARKAFADTLSEASKAGVRYNDIQTANGVTVYRRLDPTGATPKLAVRTGGAERILYDPSAGGVNAAIGSWSLSPDGKLVAIHVSEKGGEVGAIRFLDTSSGREVLKRLEPVWSEFGVEWITPTRIAFTLMDPSSKDPVQNMRAYVGNLDGSGTPVAILGAGVAGAPAFDPAEFPVIDASGEGNWVVGVAAGARADQRFFVAPREGVASGKPAWRTLSTLEDKVGDVEIRGDFAWILSTKTASFGSVERLDLKSGERKRFDMPAGTVITDLHSTREGIYASAQKDGAAQLFFIDADGSTHEIRLPFEGDFTNARPAVDGRGIAFTLMGWTTAPQSFRAENGRLESLGLDSVSWAPAKDFVVHRDEATSADGTRVPLVTVTPKGTGPWPTILESYGSYGAPTTTPWYNSYILAWTGRGGAAAYCGTRGGNERGRDWHEGGRAQNKPNAHADYLACAERLIKLGYARKGGIAATGTSAGGLLAPVAVQKRPELFGALLPRVAILNASRLEAADNGPNQYSEMGDPRTADGFKALVREDAYLGLASATALPDTLVTIGLNDKRVAPWMGAKFAARARERFGKKTLVMIRADAEQGHGIGSQRNSLIEEWADVFAFLSDRLSAAEKR